MDNGVTPRPGHHPSLGESSYRRFLDGDESGMAELIRDYKDGLMMYLIGITRDFHAAEDIMEDTFVKLVVKKPRYSEKYSFKTWLYTIGRNAAVDYLRRNSKKSGSSVDDLADFLTDEENLERAYLKEEQKISLHKVMATLNPDYRQVLYLSFFEDLSNAEIAAVMHKSKRQIEVLIYHAKISLRSKLEKEGFTYEEL